MTFLDSGVVNFSNPVRQSLFTHDDARQGKQKAERAFTRAKDVLPDLQGGYVSAEIPMPGHPASWNQDNVNKLKELVASHDVICMLTDSRETKHLAPPR